MVGRGRPRRACQPAKQYLSRQANETPYHNAGPRFANAPKGTTVRKDGDSYILQIGKDTIAIPDELLPKLGDGEIWCNVSGHFTTTHCFLAVHEDVGYPHNVACINRMTGTTEWKSKACGSWWDGVEGTGFISWVAVVVDDERVVAFGSTSTGFYAHGFRLDNGKTLFQFSSSF